MDGAWHDSSLQQAALSYRRAAGWDFAPGDTGIWLLMLAPVAASGPRPAPGPTRGAWPGFAVLYDRDQDGLHESVGHVWTAAAWRRRGIARRLLRQARERFGSDRVEGPCTDSGAALVRACPGFSEYPGAAGKQGRYIDDPGPDWWPDDDEARSPADDLMLVGSQVRESLNMSLAEFGEARLAGTLDLGNGEVAAMSDMADQQISQSLDPGGRFSEEEAEALAEALGEPRLAALFKSYRPA